MKQEAQANAEADSKAKEKAEKINQADSLIFQTENQLKEYGSKLSDSNKAAISNGLERLKEAHRSQDAAAIDAALATLNAAWQAAAGEMYQQAGAGNTADANAGQNPNAGSTTNDANNNVSDVEYEEVNDNTKK